MTEIFNFQSGEFAGKTVRVTKEATPRVSVLDITTIACEQNGNPSLYFARLCDTYPDVRTSCSHFKFPGQGQRDTPVTDARGIVKILMLLPGRKAATFREQAADTLVRYLGGDETLIAEIHAIRAEAEANPNSTAAFFRAAATTEHRESGGGEDERELERAERRMRLREKEMELRVKELDLQRMERTDRRDEVSFLVELRGHLPLFGLDQDPRIKVRIADQIQNAVGGAVPAAIEPSAAESSAMTVAAYLKQRYNTSHDLDTRISCWVGRKAAALYKSRYGISNPNKSIKFVNGESRPVMVYTRPDYDLVDEAIRIAVEQHIFDEQTLRYLM